MSAAALLSTAALAADGPQGSVTWKGFYVGAQAGGFWGDDESFTHTPTGNAWFPAAIPLLTEGGSGSFSNSGFTGGVHAGYVWQTGRVVFGYEIDVNSLNLSDRRSGEATLLAPADIRFRTEGSSDWYATFRGRLGLAFDKVLVYGTGGLAVGERNVSQSVSFLFNGTEASGSRSETATGWVAGAGIELALSQNWTIRAEYLHVDLGSTSANLFNPGLPAFTHKVESDLSFDVGRFAFSYKF